MCREHLCLNIQLYQNSNLVVVNSVSVDHRCCIFVCAYIHMHLCYNRKTRSFRTKYRCGHQRVFMLSACHC